MDVFDIEVDQKYWDSIICDDLEESENILNFENCLISAVNLNIKNKFSSIKFKSCSFTGHQEIKNINYGKAFIIENCIAENPFSSRINVRKINCIVFKHEDPYNNDSEVLLDESRLFLNIEECVFEHFTTNCRSLPLLTNVCFVKKAKITSENESDESIFFKNCVFINHLDLTFNNFKKLSLNIEHSKSYSNEGDLKNIDFRFKNSSIEKINIQDSKLGEVNLNLFQNKIDNISIFASEVKRIDLHTKDNSSDSSTTYNISITESIIDSLLLNNRKVIHPINFRNTEFLSAPSFLGTSITHGNTFPEISYFISRSGNEDAAAYRTLRYTMENHRDRNLEGMFFALEQESILNKDKGFLKYLTISYLYKIFSEYGTNTARPIIIFFISILIFSLSYALINSPKINISLPIDGALIKESLTFSLQQSLSPFSYLRNAKPENGISLTLLALTILQSIISIACIALSGLVIRWKFKRG